VALLKMFDAERCNMKPFKAFHFQHLGHFWKIVRRLVAQIMDSALSICAAHFKD